MYVYLYLYIYIYIYHIRMYLCVYSPSLEKGTQGLLYKRVGGVPKGYESRRSFAAAGGL